nr:hypothetical protein [Azotobacter chroococcum]
MSTRPEHPDQGQRHHHLGQRHLRRAGAQRRQRLHHASGQQHQRRADRLGAALRRPLVQRAPPGHRGRRHADRRRRQRAASRRCRRRPARWRRRARPADRRRGC